MADRKDIVVTLRLESTEAGNKKEPQVDVGSPDDNKGDSTAKAVFKAVGVQALNVAVSEVVAWADYYWERELILNDDYIGQREKRIAMQCINKAKGFLTSTASGLAMGSVAGPIGAAVGAAIGAATSIAGTLREDLQGKDQQEIMLKQMNAQLSFTRQRAGWSLEAASIGEDL